MTHTLPLERQRKAFESLQNQQFIYHYQARRMSAPVFFKRHFISIYIRSRELIYGLSTLPVHCLSALEWKTQVKVSESWWQPCEIQLCYVQSPRSCTISTSMTKHKYDESDKGDNVQKFTALIQVHSQCTLACCIHTKLLPISHLHMLDNCSDTNIYVTFEQ